MEEKSIWEKMMKRMTIFSALATIVFVVLNIVYDRGIFLTLAITFGTICYHLTMRLAVGFFFYTLSKKMINYKSKWFSKKAFEEDFYRKVKIKKWKNKLPTYYPEDFSVKRHTMEELIQTMCISEIGHETMVVFSYLPLLFSVLFGEFYVFLITSFFAGGVDFVFVMVQRYNRFRLEKILERRKKIYLGGKDEF